MKDKEKIKNLMAVIDEYVSSGLSISDFVREHSFKEYGLTGAEELKDVATEYFIEKLN